MANKFKTLASLALGGIGAAGAVSLYAHKARNQSTKSFLMEKSMRYLGAKKIWRFLSDEESGKERMLQINEKYNPHPAEYIDEPVQETECLGMKVYTWNDNGRADQSVLFFLHGGAYVFAGSKFHIDAIDDIAKQTGAKVVYADYFRIPEYTYKESYPPVIELYKQVAGSVSDSKQITLIGDSAGGGYSLGLLDYIEHTESLPSPKQVVAISPWVDITSKGSENPLESIDPLLDIDPLNDLGKTYWAGNPESYKNPLVSPMYSDLNFSVPVYLYAGTREVLFPDIQKFSEKLSKNDKEVYLTVGKEMVHDYPIFPTPEAQKVRDEIAQLI